MNIFIAFANEDRDVRDKLLRQMNLVKDRQGWLIWSASELKGGDPWDTEIKRRLMDSDVVLLLLSTDFFNSSYITETELPEVIKKHKAGNCQIIPVIARKCHWKDTSFGDYAQLGDIQALPAGEKPIMSKMLWGDEDEPYFETVQGIKEAILAFRAGKNKKTEPVSSPSNSATKKPVVKNRAAAPKKSATLPAEKPAKKPPSGKKTVQKIAPPPKTTLLDDIVQFFEKTNRPVQANGLLFPLYGVTLGKTRVNELKTLGIHSEQIDSATKSPYLYYVIEGTNFWYRNDIANDIYLTYTNTMPQKWKNIGFDWSLSYNDWMKLFDTLGYEVQVTKSPKIVQYDGHPSFSAQVMGRYAAAGIKYRIELAFNFSNAISASAKKTLYSLRVTTE